MSEPMYEYQNHLTAPPIPVGGYTEKTMSDEEIGKIIKDQADMCMAILNGDENIMRENKCLSCEHFKNNKLPYENICKKYYTHVDPYNGGCDGYKEGENNEC